jgi:hypothetical protein
LSDPHDLFDRFGVIIVFANTLLHELGRQCHER